MDGTRLVSMDIDRNFDGTIDRWEYYAANGSLEKVGFSRANDGVADAWAYEGTLRPGGAHRHLHAAATAR